MPDGYDDNLPLTRLVERISFEWLPILKRFLANEVDNSLLVNKLAAMRVVLDNSLQSTRVAEIVWPEIAEHLGVLPEAEQFLDDTIDELQQMLNAARRQQARRQR